MTAEISTVSVMATQPHESDVHNRTDIGSDAHADKQFR